MVRPTRYGVLGALALLAAALTWGVLRVLDSRTPLVPPLPPTVPLGLLALALGIGVSALALRRRLRGDPGTRRVDPLAAARMLALAKAAAHAGALLLGCYAGLALFLLPDAGLTLRRGRLVLALLSVLAALALTGSGLLLERVCRVDPPEDPPPGAAAPA